MQRATQVVPTRAGVRAAHDIIRPFINYTPVLQSDSLSLAASSPDLRIRFFFKCENLQKSGSFKFRGEYNFIAHQPDHELRRGVVAVSTGNFGNAVALATRTAAQARRLTIDTTVILPATSAPSKIAHAQQNGARVVLAGTNPQDRELMAKQILSETGASLIGPMDDPRIVCGQGTATLELMDQVEQAGSRLDAIVLPSATGGLLAGAAVVCQEAETLVFGCEPSEGGPDLQHGFMSGILSKPTNQHSIADGLRASTSRGNFDLIRQHVSGIYTASELDIAQAWRLIIEETRLLVEPSSAVSITTVLMNQELRERLAAQKRDWNIGIILTGGNTTISRMIKEISSL